MNNETDWVVLGRFGRPQGLKGLVRVISFTDPESSILKYTPWHMQQNSMWVPVELTNSLTQNKSILVQVAGYVQREEVAQLTHIEIGVLRSRLPKLPSGEYYWHDLANMCVRNLSGVVLGHVEDVLPTGANDVLVVCGEKRHLIPYIPDMYIVSIDSEQRQIVVDWDEHF